MEKLVSPSVSQKAHYFFQAYVPHTTWAERLISDDIGVIGLVICPVIFCFFIFPSWIHFFIFPSGFLICFIISWNHSRKVKRKLAEYPLISLTEVSKSSVIDKKICEAGEGNDTTYTYYIAVKHPITEQVFGFPVLSTSSRPPNEHTYLFLYDSIEIGDTIEIRHHATDNDVLCLVLYQEAVQFLNWWVSKK